MIGFLVLGVAYAIFRIMEVAFWGRMGFAEPPDSYQVIGPMIIILAWVWGLGIYRTGTDKKWERDARYPALYGMLVFGPLIFLGPTVHRIMESVSIDTIDHLFVIAFMTSVFGLLIYWPSKVGYDSWLRRNGQTPQPNGSREV